MGKALLLLLAIYPLHHFLDQLPDRVPAPSSYSLTLWCHGLFSFNTSGAKSNLSIDCSLSRSLTLSACLSDIIMKWTVPMTNVWIAFGCYHSCLDGTTWKEEREDKGVICPSLGSFSQGGRPYQRLEICCCDCDIISCPVKIRGPNLWFRHLVALSTNRRDRSPGFFPRRYLSTPQMFSFFLWGISGSLKRGFKACFE